MSEYKCPKCGSELIVSQCKSPDCEDGLYLDSVLDCTACDGTGNSEICSNCSWNNILQHYEIQSLARAESLGLVTEKNRDALLAVEEMSKHPLSLEQKREQVRKGNPDGVRDNDNT